MINFQFGIRVCFFHTVDKILQPTSSLANSYRCKINDTYNLDFKILISIRNISISFEDRKLRFVSFESEYNFASEPFETQLYHIEP